MKIDKNKASVEQIKKAVRMRLKYIRDKKIFENAVEVLRKLGNYQEHIHSDHVGAKGFFEESFGKEILKIEYHTFGQFDENSNIKIYFDGKLVFDAEHSAWFPESDPKKAEKTINLLGADKNDLFFVVDVYKEGEWESWISVKQIKSYRRERFLKNESEQIKNKKDQETREFLERVESVMEDLGIELR